MLFQFARAFALVMFCVMLPLAGGCSDTQYKQPKQWSFEFYNDKDNTRSILKMDRVVIVFEDQPRSTTSSGDLTVSGPIPLAGSVGSGPSTFTRDWNPQEGANTMTYGGHTFKVAEGGRALLVGDKRFDLGGDKITVVVKKDGSARIAPEQVGYPTTSPEEYKKLMGAVGG